MLIWKVGCIERVGERGTRSERGGPEKCVSKGEQKVNEYPLPLLGGRRYVASSPSWVGETRGEGDAALGKGERPREGRAARGDGRERDLTRFEGGRRGDPDLRGRRGRRRTASGAKST